MSDNEHTAASLGHSEPSSVKYPPDHAIPEVHEAPDDRSEGVLMSAGGESMNVLSNNPGRATLSNDPMHLPPERATVTSQSCTASCHAVVLAGESSGENIDCWRGGDVMDVSEVGNVRPVVGEDLCRPLRVRHPSSKPGVAVVLLSPMPRPLAIHLMPRPRRRFPLRLPR